MKERISKIIASRGIASRRRADELIAAGKVKVNGRVASLGDKADELTDSIAVEGRALPEPEEKVYIMLNKPRGYVTTLSDEKGRRTVMELVSGCGARVYPVGRLDMNSEGLLLFTNDGQYANLVMHPSNEVRKQYRVSVRGDIDAGIKRLLEPMELDGRPITKPVVKLLHANEGNSVLSVTIFEGRNRQIRRMCEIAGLKITRLIRTGEGSLALGSLRTGKWRRLTKKEAMLALR
jgi:23S rRNA pseudouridine2605 synthase